jgi:hypothetical protein
VSAPVRASAAALLQLAGLDRPGTGLALGTGSLDGAPLARELDALRERLPVGAGLPILVADDGEDRQLAVLELDHVLLLARWALERVEQGPADQEVAR